MPSLNVSTVIRRARVRVQPGHRVRRVGQQVEQHLLQLVAVSLHADLFGAQLLVQLDAAEPEVVGDEQGGAFHHGVQVHPGRLGRLLPGEGQQILHDESGARGLLVHHPQVLPVARPEIFSLEQELRQSRDRGERVVELVGDAGDQLSHRGQLFVLDELGLERPLLGHILDQDDRRRAVQRLGERGGGESQHPVERLAPDHDRRGSFSPARGGEEIAGTLRCLRTASGQKFRPDQARKGGSSMRARARLARLNRPF